MFYVANISLHQCLHHREDTNAHVEGKSAANVEDDTEEINDYITVDDDSSIDDDIHEKSRLITDKDLFENDLLDNFVSNVEDPDIFCDREDKIDDKYSFLDEIPTTDASDGAFLVHELTEYGSTFGETVISGQAVLNQCGTLLTWKQHQIKGSLKQKNMLQRMYTTSR
eukprot:6640089-Ditylum_brightwellii.AAC.1